MRQLQPIQIDEQTVIYIEPTEDIEAGAIAATEETEEVTRGSLGAAKGGPVVSKEQVAKSFQAIQSTIQTYTRYTLNAFHEAALSEVQKVTLEFGVNVSGVGGVPYIAAGTAGCNIKITVECGFNAENADEQSDSPQSNP